MRLRQRLAAWLDPQLEQRASLFDSAYFANIASGATASGQVVNARTAENLSTVLACVSAIATACGSLPAYVYRLNGSSRAEDPAHPLARLISHGPNRHQTWPDFIEWLMASTLLKGNGLAEIVTDGAGTVTELRPVPWDWVSVVLLPTGRLAYDIVEVNALYGGTGRSRRLLQGEVFHLKDRSDDGYVGRSRLSRAAEVVGTALAGQDFAGALWRNGINPSGALTAAGQLPPVAKQQLREAFERVHAGSRNAAKALILDQGVTWQQMSMSPEDAEVLASRKHSVEEICRIYQVPPPIVQDYSHNTFTNSEAAGRWFAQFTIGPWVRKIEAEAARCLLSQADRATHALELDMSGFLRGDPESRWRSHEIALRNNVLDPNEVREVEGWNPRPPGAAAAPQGEAEAGA